MKKKFIVALASFAVMSQSMLVPVMANTNSQIGIAPYNIGTDIESEII